jgi:hypothetical protein
MAIDPKSLKKLESFPAAAQAMPRDEKERLLVLVRLRDGGRRPDYVISRADVGPQIFSAEISVGDLRRLEADPDVEAVSISRRIPLMK